MRLNCGWGAITNAGFLHYFYVVYLISKTSYINMRASLRQGQFGFATIIE